MYTSLFAVLEGGVCGGGNGRLALTAKARSDRGDRGEEITRQSKEAVGVEKERVTTNAIESVARLAQGQTGGEEGKEHGRELGTQFGI